MIQKPNSQILMDQIDETIQNVKDIKNTIKETTRQIETKLSILDAYHTIALQTLSGINKIEEKVREKDTVVFSIDQTKIVGGAYEQYGQTIHPKLANLSDQVFNFMTDTGPLFKDNVSVSFIYDKTTVTNGISNTETVTDTKYEYCNILKHEEDPTKLDVFQFFPVSHIQMVVEIKPGNLIGNTVCNMIELCPYLPGTFSINEIRIWTIDQYLSQQLEDPADITITGNFTNVGPERIKLDAAYQIFRIEFDITIQEQENGFPFGIRHIYFYNAKMDTANSYAVVKIERDGYISSLGDSVTILTPDRKVKYLHHMYGNQIGHEIEYYAIYENDMLQVKLDPDAQLARNMTTFYVKIPLFEPIMAITFNNVTVR